MDPESLGSIKIDYFAHCECFDYVLTSKYDGRSNEKADYTP